MGDLFFVIRLLQWFREAPDTEPPVERRGAILYRVCRPARYFFGFGILFTSAMGVLSFLVGDIEWYIRAAYIPGVAFLFTRWPWTVKLDRAGVSKRSYVAIRTTVRWSDVSALAYDRPTRRFTVVGRTGARIRCTPFMVAPPHFYREVYRQAPALGPMPTRNLNKLT
jgi:hypothetical protein